MYTMRVLKAAMAILTAFHLYQLTQGFTSSYISSNIMPGHLKLESKSQGFHPFESLRQKPRSLHRSQLLARRWTNHTDDLLLEVVRSFSRVAGFIAREAEKANDDLFLSLRVTQGQLTQLRTDAPWLWTDGATAQLLQSAETDIDLADAILLRNFEANEELSDVYSFMMDRDLWSSLERLDAGSTIGNLESLMDEVQAKRTAENQDELKFTENTSDDCLSQLQLEQNSDEVVQTTGQNFSCPVTQQCWRMMTTPRTTGYYLTHQLLFLSLGSSAGCGPDLERLARAELAAHLTRPDVAVVPDLMRLQCRNILSEARAISVAGYPHRDKDLFLEQGLLCGAVVTMPEFFEPAMVRSAVSWQKANGCFGFVNVEAFLDQLSPEEVAAIKSRADDFTLGRAALKNDINKERFLKAGSENLYRHLGYEENGYQMMRLFSGQSWTSNVMARLENNAMARLENDPMTRFENDAMARREKVMSKSCLSHNTAVAMGYLGVAMRYLAVQ